MWGLWRRLATVPGEWISAKASWSSPQAIVVPLGERLGVPSGHTVATKPSRCSPSIRFIAVVRMGMVHSFVTVFWPLGRWPDESGEREVVLYLACGSFFCPAERKNAGAL